MFSVVAKVFLVLAALPCFLLGIAAYKFARRRLQGEDHFHSRMSLVYALVAGSMLARAIFHGFAASGPFFFFFVLLGIAVMDGFFARRGRVANSNPHYVAPDVATTLYSEPLVNRETGDTNTYVRVSKWDASFAEVYLNAVDSYK
jgi:hypothetical protein